MRGRISCSWSLLKASYNIHSRSHEFRVGSDFIFFVLAYGAFSYSWTISAKPRAIGFHIFRPCLKHHALSMDHLARSWGRQISPCWSLLREPCLIHGPSLGNAAGVKFHILGLCLRHLGSLTGRLHQFEGWISSPRYSSKEPTTLSYPWAIPSNSQGVLIIHWQCSLKAPCLIHAPFSQSLGRSDITRTELT